MPTYAEKLKDPRWQKKRLEILARDNWACTFCYDDSSTLHVHHLVYTGSPWDAPSDTLVTLCETCHEYETTHRKAAETRLCNALKIRKFDSGSVRNLADAFASMPEFHAAEVMESIISWALTNRDILAALKEQYFEYISSENRVKDH